MATHSPRACYIHWMIALTALLFAEVGPAHAQAPNRQDDPAGSATKTKVAPQAAPASPAAVLAKASTKRGPIVAEQRKHLRRLTKLNQLLVIARQESNNDLTARVEALLKKEKERHIRHLMQLKIGKKILMAPPRLPAPAEE